jgi:hypothetical protein
MSRSQVEVILRRFESPDETRIMEKGKFEVVRTGGLTVRRATYEPGWRWSEHAGPTIGAKRCTVAHVGLVVSGTATAALDNGPVFELHAGELFCIPRSRTTAGWLATSRMYLSTFWVRTTMPSSRRTERLNGPGRGLRSSPAAERTRYATRGSSANEHKG